MHMNVVYTVGIGDISCFRRDISPLYSSPKPILCPPPRCIVVPALRTAKGRKIKSTPIPMHPANHRRQKATPC